MNKKLLKSEKEYREWAFSILSERQTSHISNAIGARIEDDCWGFNDKNQPIDEDGNVIPDETPESLELADWVKEINYPIVMIHCFEKSWDRIGDLEICFAEYVSLADFKN